MMRSLNLGQRTNRGLRRLIQPGEGRAVYCRWIHRLHAFRDHEDHRLQKAGEWPKGPELDRLTLGRCSRERLEQCLLKTHRILS